MEFMHLLLYLGVLFTFINTNNSNSDVSRTRSSSSSSPFHEKESEDDEIQRRSTGKSSLGWTAWSDFSTCSRTCDGGVATQLRRCNNPQGCKGESVRYKICNMQACPDHRDFRAQQCTAFDEVPYDGALFKWSPHYDYAEPCALTCRGRPEDLRDERQSEEQLESTDEESKEASVIVQLTNRVQDGTRCRPGSLDMCIQGKCQRVGCDLKIGSTKKIDLCGVCAGDGSTCTKPLYHWDIAPMSMCSVTCGGGYKMSVPMCRNRLTAAEVEESLCNHGSRPEPTVVQCNTHACPPKWISDEWGPCNKTCGGGVRERLVVCAEESNGARHRVPNEACRGIRPKVHEICNTHDCPKWVASEWSGCSSSCGRGMQVRSVECVDLNGIHNTQCDPNARPDSIQSCDVGIPCTNEVLTTEIDMRSPSSEKPMEINEDDDDEDDVTREVETQEYEVSEDVGGGENLSKVEVKKSSNTEDSEDEEDDDEMQGDDPIDRNRNIPLNYQYRITRADRLFDPNPNPVPNEPTFIPGEWGPCSVTCGEGVRRRRFECKIFLEFSKVIATLDGNKCHTKRPADEYERCFMEPCSYAYGVGPGMYDSDTYRTQNRDRINGDQIKVQPAAPGLTYSWRDEGYTACSASCLGGVEELIINCVRDDTGKVVSPYLCSPETKPENRIRTCNDIPCPPRWNYSDYSACTKSCGIGIKTREINCIHEVTRGGENTMIVPNSMCPQPPPSDRQYCNVLDCPARWEVAEWTRCSKTCGGGYKNRTVLCKQTMAQDHKVGRVDSLCPGIKPAIQKLCNTKPCPPEDDRPIISANDGGKYIQHDPSQKKISLKVGGAAQVFYGVQVKIKCPVKKYNRTKIRWSKDHNFLPKSRKYKVSKKGALRILDVTFKDAGVYTCHAGLSVADIQLTIKPKPGEFPSSEENDRGRDPDTGGRNKYSDSPQTITGHGRNASNNTRQRQRYNNNRHRNKHVNDNPVSVDGRLKDEEEPLQSHSQMTHTDSSSLTPQTSSAKRNLPLLPHFEHLLASFQFLWPFQAFRNSKGHQMLIDKHLKYSIEDVNDEREEQDDPHAMRQTASEAIEKSISDDLEFEYYVGPWSSCSQTCGLNDSGYRLRSVHCMVRVKNTTKNVDNILCEDAGLRAPDTIEKCGNVPCPLWITTEWTVCRLSKCFAWHTALQKRNVSCSFDNETVSDKCDENEKPTTKQECYNELCKGVWRVEQWSECNAPCGRKGTRYRTLQCVWYGTRKPAGNACNNQPRPAVIKPCNGPTCIVDSSDCKDISMYCNNVKTMGLCRLHRFQQTCCNTCKFNVYEEKKEIKMK